MSQKIVLVLLVLVFPSCKNSDSAPVEGFELDCSAVLCAAGFNDLYLNFSGEANGDNLLDNETIDPSTIEIMDEEDEEVSFTLKEASDLGKFLVIPVSTEAYGQKSFTINFEGRTPFTIDFNTSFVPRGECCGPYTLLEDIDISVYAHELVELGHLPLNITLIIPDS